MSSELASIVTWERFLAFVLVKGVAAVTPGPAALLVLSYGLRRGQRDAMWAASGIVATNAAYYILAGLGLATLLRTSHGVFALVRIAGVAYLGYLGIQSLHRAMRGPGAAEVAVGAGTGWPTLARAMLLQVINPRALALLLALLTQFIDPARPFLSQLVVLGATSLVIEFLVLAIYAHGAARLSRFADAPHAAAVMLGASGALLLGTAAWLAVAMRDGP